MLSTIMFVAALAPQEPRTHEPPPFEKVFGSAIVRENVGTNLRLNQDTTTQWQDEYSLAINPLDPNNFLASSNDYRTGRPNLGLYVSLDGGQSIINDGLLPLDGWPESGDPCIAYDGFGNGYIGGLHFSRSPFQGALYVHKTTDKGRTFQAPVQAYFANDLPDKPFLTADQRTSGPFAGSLYMTFTPFFSSLRGLQCIHSRDGGQTWSRPVRIGSGQGTSPACGPNGEVYIAWQDGGRIRFNSSTDGGATFGSERTVANIQANPSPLSPSRFRCNSFPSTTVDRSGGPFDGRVHVSWSSRSAGSSEIFSSYSDNGGNTWSTPVRVNDAAAGDQFFQWMACDENGTLFCCWHDRRNDATNNAYECFASASYDGGQTWIQNWLVSETMNNPGFTSFIGDYNGLDARRGRAFATWVDFRRGNQDGFTAAVQGDLEFSPDAISASAGGTIDLPIKAGPARAGDSYVLFANFTGTNAGLPLSAGVSFTLNLDILVEISAFAANTAPFINTAGVLGAGGIASPQPQFVAPAGFATPLVGREISFAYLLLDPNGSTLTYGSNPASVTVNS